VGERLNGQVERRTEVIGIFPNDDPLSGSEERSSSNGTTICLPARPLDDPRNHRCLAKITSSDCLPWSYDQFGSAGSLVAPPQATSHRGHDRLRARTSCANSASKLGTEGSNVAKHAYSDSGLKHRFEHGLVGLHHGYAKFAASRSIAGPIGRAGNQNAVRADTQRIPAKIDERSISFSEPSSRFLARSIARPSFRTLIDSASG
jgi:hypothetical protein